MKMARVYEKSMGTSEECHRVLRDDPAGKSSPRAADAARFSFGGFSGGSIAACAVTATVFFRGVSSWDNPPYPEYRKQELLLTTHGGTPLSRSARILLTDGRKRTRKKDQNVSVELSRSFLCFFAAHR